MPDNSLVREFFVLKNERVRLNSDRPRLEYFETDHDDLANQIDLLVESGYVRDVSTTKTPIFRMSEEFVRKLKDED